MCLNMIGCSAAATTNYVYKTFLCPIFKEMGRVFRDAHRIHPLHLVSLHWDKQIHNRMLIELNSSICGRISFALMRSSNQCLMVLHASRMYKRLPRFDQLNVLPDASVIVPLIIIGRVLSLLVSLKYFLIAKMAAFAFNVSKIVSINKRSTPPSTNPLCLFIISINSIIKSQCTDNQDCLHREKGIRFCS